MSALSDAPEPRTWGGEGKRAYPRLPREIARACAIAIWPLLATIQPPAWAQGRSARDYLNAPIDTWLSFSNTGYSRSVTPADGLDIASRVRTNVFSQSVILTRTMDFGGRTGGLSAIIPYVAADASAGGARESNNGFSDLGFMWQMNIFGGPALTREQFRDFVPQTFSSVHVIVLAPTGKYNASDSINPSSNRWTLYPTVNYSYTPDKGWTWLELYLSAKLFSPNHDFGPGSSRLSQKPLYLAELHASRNVTPTVWISADAYYNTGGETRIDAQGMDNAADTLRLGVGSGMSLWRGGSVMLNYEQVVSKPSGQPESRAFRLKIQQVW